MAGKKKQIELIDLYWRTANYISVVQMYLKNNLLLETPITVEHLRNTCGGHWGTTPGINFLYAHLNASIKNHNLNNVMLTIGPGHAAAALLSNLYLEGTLQEYYPDLTLDEAGFEKFIQMVQASNGFRSEINPKFPGTIYDGGELGYSISVAYGAVIDNPDLIVVCIVGDGEAEAGPLASSWHGLKFINPKQDGIVLPVLHLNHYKMASKSIYANMSEKDLLSYFSGLGYEAKIVEADHAKVYDAFNWAFTRIKGLKNEGKISKQKSPLVIFKSLKGWTGVENINDVPIEGSARAHKNPTSLCSSNEELCDVLNCWLAKYNPVDLIDYSKRAIKSEVFNKILPQKNKRMGMNICANNGGNCKPLILPQTEDFLATKDNNDVVISGMEVAAKYISQLISLNKDQKNFIIVSPDELTSNRLGEILETTKRRFVGDGEADCECAPDGRVFEILSEHCCQGWLQGYLLTGRYGLFPTYEAFAPIVNSMLTQFCKFLYQAKQVRWRREVASINYLLTSLCWSNTYSHQNPEFVSSIIGKCFSFVRAYFPVDRNSLLVCIEKCIKSKGLVNVITASKRVLPQWLNEKEARQCIEQGFFVWPDFEEKDKVPDIIFSVTGDFLINEGVNAIKKLQEFLPNLNYRLVAIAELSVIGINNIYPDALSEDKFKNIFPLNIPVVFGFHGYASTIKQLLFDREENNRFHVLGYCDKSDISASVMNKMIANDISRYHMVLRACDALYDKKVLSNSEYRNISKHMNEKIVDQ